MSKRGRRNPHCRPWRGRNRVPGLFDRITALFSLVARRFPWLVYHTTTEAAQLVQDHLQAAWSVDFRENTVCITGPVGGYVRLRANHRPWRRIDRLSGCEAVHESAARGHSVYLLKMTAGEAQVTLRESTRMGAVTARLGLPFGAGNAARGASRSRESMHPARRP